MEFSDTGKANAVKFLREFTARARLPEAGEALPVRLNWRIFTESELEAVCLDMTRSYLAER